MRVNYTTEEGNYQIREVPEGANPKTYKYGILVGPPDLSDLPLSTKQIKELTKELALAGLGNYDDTRGKRDQLMDIIKKVTGKKNKDLMRLVLYLYQKSLFED